MKNIFDKIEIPSQSSQIEIPDLDLYVDQITTIFEKGFSNERRHESDKLLTKSMVNNYCKEGVLKSIKGKKYSKSHVIMMQMIYNLKKTMSIIDIKALLASVETEIGEDKYTYKQDRVEELYVLSLENQELAGGMLKDIIAKSRDEIKLSKDEKGDTLLLALYLSDMSSKLRQASEGIIDTLTKE